MLELLLPPGKSGVDGRSSCRRPEAVNTSVASASQSRLATRRPGSGRGRRDRRAQAGIDASGLGDISPERTERRRHIRRARSSGFSTTRAARGRTATATRRPAAAAGPARPRRCRRCVPVRRRKPRHAARKGVAQRRSTNGGRRPTSHQSKAESMRASQRPPMHRCRVRALAPTQRDGRLLEA